MADPRVLNLRTFTPPGQAPNPWTKFALPDDAARVDRRTIWGNPFEIGQTVFRVGEGDVVLDRAGVIECFLGYMLDRLEGEPHWLEPLRGKRLACWCAPLPCHAELIIQWLDAHPPVVPRAGGAIEFGQHRQPAPEADTAPAWGHDRLKDRHASRLRRWGRQVADG